MNKSELVKNVAQKTGLTAKMTEKVVNTLLETIKDTVSEGDRIQIPGFGTFEARERAERQGLVPSTGEKIIIPASTVPAFKAGKNFKDMVNQKGE